MTYFTPFPSVSITDFKQVNVCWVAIESQKKISRVQEESSSVVLSSSSNKVESYLHWRLNVSQGIIFYSKLRFAVNNFHYFAFFLFSFKAVLIKKNQNFTCLERLTFQ